MIGGAIQSQFHQKHNYNMSTLIGSGALFLWTIEAVMVAELIRVPIFEAAALLFSTSFIATAIRLTISKRWHVIKNQPIAMWMIGLICICGSDLAYMWAFKFSPAAHVDLIDYCWPFFMILVVAFLPNEKLTWKDILGSVLGLIGILCLVLSPTEAFGKVSLECWFGYGLAFLGMIAWGGYSAYSSQKKEVPIEMTGLYCLLGAVICWVLHFAFEQTLMPTTLELSMAMLLGLTGAGLAYQLWDYGMRFGDLKLLGILCYITRPIAIGLLILFGKAEPSKELFFSCLLITVGVIVTAIDLNALDKFFTKSLKKMVKLAKSNVFKKKSPVPT